MKSQLYLWEPLRQKYIDDLTALKTIVEERFLPVFANIGEETDTYKNNIWYQIMDTPCSEDTYYDPGDFVDDVRDKGIEHYEMLSLMRYRNISTWICTLCQVWDQQIYSFVIKEAEHSGFEYKDSDRGRGFAFSKDAFLWHQQDFEKMPIWPKIKELRSLVNVLKHGEGTSEKQLRKTRPDFFSEEVAGIKYDGMSLYHTTLLEPTLNISEKDFREYFEALVSFWSVLPERMYTAEDI